MLPQGVFSVAVATVLFPTLSRMASRRERRPRCARRSAAAMRQINLLLIPAAAFMMVLADADRAGSCSNAGSSTPQSTHLVSIALFWFAFSLPFGGMNLLLTRTFFAVQRPWIPTRLAAMNIVVDIIVSVGALQAAGDRRA